MTKKMTTRQARKALVYGSDNEKDAVKQELASIAASNITDVLKWTESGAMALLKTDDIPMHVQKAIKKVKVTPSFFFPKTNQQCWKPKGMIPMKMRNPDTIQLINI